MKREIKDQPGSGTKEQGSHDACKLSADAGFNCTVADLLTSQVSLPFAWITGHPTHSTPAFSIGEFDFFLAVWEEIECMVHDNRC